MFGLLARVAVGAVAAAVGVAAVEVAREEIHRREELRSRECQLCHKELSGNVRPMKCCDQKFHHDCLRAYFQSLHGCPIKCPGTGCGKTLNSWETVDFEVPLPTEKIYYCHHCCSIVKEGRPRVLPCTHRFCVECIRLCMTAFVAVMLEEPRCPMSACKQAISEELLDSIMRAE